jgi:hypothetical protein
MAAKIVGWSIFVKTVALHFSYEEIIDRALRARGNMQ